MFYAVQDRDFIKYYINYIGEKELENKCMHLSVSSYLSMRVIYVCTGLKQRRQLLLIQL